MKIKTGDKVRVLAGADKGKVGEVLQVFPKLQRIVIEGVRVSTRHVRSTKRGQAGQKIEFPSPIHISNVRLVSEKIGKEGRVGYKVLQEGSAKKKVRIIKIKKEKFDIE